MTVGGCVFCAIVDGQAPASVVYRDDTVVAFMDINPVNPGHLLVVPLEHEPGLLDLDEATTAHMFTVGRRIAATLPESGVKMDAFNLFLANGESAGQTVFHVHLHVLPRFAGDGLGFQRAGGAATPERADLEELAQRIRRVGRWE